MTAAVELHDVLFRRQRRTILADVSLCINPGEKWVVFGPNGIGKSTLVSMMATRLHPTSGTVDILGNRLGKVNVFSYRHRIGLASNMLNREFDPQEDPLDVIVSAIDARVGNWYGEYTADSYVVARELMRHYGIEYLAGKRMYKLSEGERTRVGICRALMARPDILILDEPTTGLDLGGRELVVDALSELARVETRKTAILVTHRLEEIPQGFDHIALLGRLDDEQSAIIDTHTKASTEVPADGAQIINPNPGTIVYAGALEQGLTDDRLSSLFNMSLTVVHNDGRWSAFATKIAHS
ncbi:ABC transporter ATP-binding protein [Alloscardovia venturai]|uniref:ABC transporter ATP-binding protein n=1 Tax=Alloscardovia venturai TaxID=1769421 RepID=A0ABW2Y8W5_9BIFI